MAGSVDGTTGAVVGADTLLGTGLTEPAHRTHWRKQDFHWFEDDK